MIFQHNQSQTKNLEIISLAVGVTLGAIAAVILIGLILLAGLELKATPYLTNLPSYLPANWQTAMAHQAQIMGFPLQGETSAYWYMSRVSALLGYLFLWGSMFWGLLLSTKIIKSSLSPVLTFGMHQFLSLLGLGFAFFHAVILLGDRYIAFNLSDILIPFNASYEPIWAGIGTISLYLYAVITLSFYLRKHIGQKMWRTLHYLTFITYLMVVAHGLLVGTDSSLNVMRLMYLASAAGILFLSYYRILSGNPPRRKR